MGNVCVIVMFMENANVGILGDFKIVFLGGYIKKVGRLAWTVILVFLCLGGKLILSLWIALAMPLNVESTFKGRKQ